LLSAYTGEEAWSTVQATPDIGLMLLDVVMETDDAGLWLVKRIRDEAGDKNMRIILRTGQPGEAPEREVIRDYDINEYKSPMPATAAPCCANRTGALARWRRSEG
jgi:CheY-like chemotaxis protein